MSDPTDSLMPHPSPEVVEVMLTERDAHLVRAISAKIREGGGMLPAPTGARAVYVLGFKAGIASTVEWLDQFAANLENPLNPPYPPSAPEEGP